VNEKCGRYSEISKWHFLLKNKKKTLTPVKKNVKEKTEDPFYDFPQFND
jgi:hypothetical protein